MNGYKEDRSGDVWLEKQYPQSYICYLCGNEFESIDEMKIEGENVCPDCRLLTKEQIIALWIEDKQELERAQRQLGMG